jgi:Fe-S cluster assembly iron-binding protein IscA
MLTVTPAAKEKLKEMLEEVTADQEVSIRIIRQPSRPNWLKLVLSERIEGDQVVESEDKRTLLLMGSDLAPLLKHLVIDYAQASSGFTLSPSSEMNSP